MPLLVTGAGAGEPQILPGDAFAGLNGRIVVNGPGNQVEIGPDSVAAELDIELGENCILRLGRGCNFGNLVVYAARDAQVSIGAASGFNGRVRLLLHEPGRITIGEGCLFAGGVEVMVSDMHSVVDVATGARLNPARDVSVGDSVWVGQNATLLKGSQIGAGSVIGAGAVVTGRIPAQVMAAGVPARVLREGVSWRHALI